MINLSTNYMGIKLKNPIIAGASSLSSDMATIKRIEAAGAGAIVIKSLFEEEIQIDSFKFDEDIKKYEHIHAEMTSIFPNIEHNGAKEHLYWVKRTKEEINIPVIASLNAEKYETWVNYAKALEEAGVDGLELNFYSLPIDGKISSRSVEDTQIEILKKVKNAVNIPVAVKLSPYYTSISNFVSQLDSHKVDALVLFNRLFQPEIDVKDEKEKFVHRFSDSTDNQLPLRWTALLSNKVNANIVASTGIMNGEDAMKMILAGASAIQVVSTLYKNKIEVIKDILLDIERFMEQKGYTTLDEFRGKLSKEKAQDPWAYERTQYIKALLSDEIAL